MRSLLAVIALLMAGCSTLSTDPLPKQPDAPTSKAVVTTLGADLDKTDHRVGAALVAIERNADKPKVVVAESRLAQSYLPAPPENDIAFAMARATKADPIDYKKQMEFGRKLATAVTLAWEKLEADQKEALRVSQLKDARIAELTAEVERLLDQPNSVPALDLSIDDLRWGSRSLGRIELQAVNRGAPLRQPEWRLTRLNATVPEARLTASGNWVPLGNAQGAGGGGQRRTAIGFQLAVDDAGRLLERLGREGTVRGGQGRLEGNVGWIGSPLSPDLSTLSGQLSVDIERGQFLQIEPGAGRLLGVLSLQSLPRRLVLDFRDVFSQGFAFDFFRGQGQIEQGVLSTRNLQMKGVNAAVMMEGSADLVRETQDLQVFVVPEINAGAASLLAATVNPVVGIGTLLAQLVLRQPLRSVTTQEFRVTGSWADPQVQKLDRSLAAPATEPATPLQ